MKTIKIRGNDYATVAERVRQFRKDFSPVDGWAIKTFVSYHDDERVVMAAAILNPAGQEVATGWAEEYREASKINKTSAVENCETSAIGRALAAFGYLGDGENPQYASADEVEHAIEVQEAGITINDWHSKFKSQVMHLFTSGTVTKQRIVDVCEEYAGVSALDEINNRDLAKKIYKELSK